MQRRSYSSPPASPSASALRVMPAEILHHVPPNSEDLNSGERATGVRPFSALSERREPRLRSRQSRCPTRPMPRLPVY
ncbi:unnamed protein product [Cutaneotrichosporon oleaginosum]